MKLNIGDLYKYMPLSGPRSLPPCWISVCVCVIRLVTSTELNSPAHSCQTCWGREEGTKRTMRDSIHESPTHIYSAAAWSTADMNDDSGGGDPVRWRNMLTLLCACTLKKNKND